MPPRNDTWFERNVVHPMAYGGDQAVNDWLGERGVARPVTKAVGLSAWKTAIPKPENPWVEFASEIPRQIIASGGLAGANSLPRFVGGNALAGFARDPGDLPEKEVARQRLVSAVLGAAGGVGGYAAGRVVGSIPGKVWRKTIGQDSRKLVDEYQKTFVGSNRVQQDPARLKAALNDFPTARGRLRRGVMPERTDEIAKLSNLKRGDIYEPGRALSADRHGATSGVYVKSKINPQGGYAPSGLKERGPYVHIRTNNARDLSDSEAFGVVKWEEMATLPDTKFRVEKVVRARDGRVTDVYLRDLSKPGIARNVNDAALEGLRGVTAAPLPAATHNIKIKRSDQ